MKAFKQYLLVLILGLLAVPSMAGEKMTIDMKEILWGHIKDSYEWHITNVGDHPVVINLPVIVKSSTGWHVFSSSQFSHHADEQGNRPGPYGLCIKGGEAETYPGKIVEQVDGQEVRPFDLSITKSVAVLFIDAIILLLCVLIPARWCKRHKIDDPAPSGFTGLMHMFIKSVYDDVIKAVMGDEAPKYAPYLLTCFFFIFIANLMGIVPFPRVVATSRATSRVLAFSPYAHSSSPTLRVPRNIGRKSSGRNTHMVEGSCSLDARYRACRYLHKAIGTDDPTFCQHDGRPCDCLVIRGYDFHHVPSH